MKKLIQNNFYKYRKPQKVVGTNVKSYSHYLIITGILILTFLLFRPSLNNKLTNFDDDVYVTENPYIHEL